ncbi:hypothetical protein KRR38_31175 [Novosphingobium sp. G106]|uniref:hypothetical protein n=1 Tax=Novosphingobium sp. G106 TaxID=2849500 RepID=UPI001C2CF5B4|nr:hypothetical protein [Novosphingobium sp. G106]MBV1692010.1 hypothetical protein [Novosphingobium sp. G106]
MLIDVLAGRDSGSAVYRGAFHFACSPKAGEEIEIEGAFAIVTKAWHRPDIYYKGAKFVILVEEPVGRAESLAEIRDDAGALV